MSAAAAERRTERDLAALKRHSGNVLITEAGIAVMQRRRLPRSEHERKIADLTRELYKP